MRDKVVVSKFFFPLMVTEHVQEFFFSHYQFITRICQGGTFLDLLLIALNRSYLQMQLRISSFCKEQ